MSIHQRQIKSFILRQGKTTSGQKNAIDELMPVYGIDYQEQLIIRLDEEFKSSNIETAAANDSNSNASHPIIIEIGFGMGHATAEIAKQNPENNYLGIEVHGPGVGSLLMLIEKYELNNIRVIRHDAVIVLQNMIADNSIDGFHIFFPDPWHKKRHHKRRIIQPEFVQLLCNKLKIGGYIHLATDWEDYAQHMLSVLSQNQELSNQSPSGDFVLRPSYRPLTKFEKRGINLGHKVWDLIFVKPLH